EGQGLVAVLKGLSLPIRGTLGFEKAEVTSGGVALDEVDPRTLESRRVPGLHFAGEVLDLDGLIGGYNFQAAWSTGWLAGEAAAIPARRGGGQEATGPDGLDLEAADAAVPPSPHGLASRERLEQCPRHGEGSSVVGWGNPVRLGGASPSDVLASRAIHVTLRKESGRSRRNLSPP